MWTTQLIRVWHAPNPYNMHVDIPSSSSQDRLLNYRDSCLHEFKKKNEKIFIIEFLLGMWSKFIFKDAMIQRNISLTLSKILFMNAFELMRIDIIIMVTNTTNIFIYRLFVRSVN